MKISRILLALLAMAFVFTSCEDDFEKATANSNAAPNELKEITPSEFVLRLQDKDVLLPKFEWTKTDFGYQASVTYTLQVDRAGNNFADAADVLSAPGGLGGDVKIGTLNDILLGLGLVPEEPTELEFRVVSTISTKIAPVYSASQTATFSAYATSFPPIYGMGEALKGWGPWPGNAVEWQSSEFKKYSTIAYLQNGKAFRWFAQLDWNPTSYNYPFFTSVSPVFENAADGDSNLKVAGATGWYRVDVDLGAKTVVAESVAEPQMYMVGAAVGGWDQAKAVKMTYIKPGVFEGEADFINDTFRFFAQNDWSPLSYNYPYFTSVDANFENADDDDKNLRYIGTPGKQKLRVDLNEKTVVLGDIPDPVIYMTGAALNGWSWDAGIPVAMTYKGPGQFEATATFTSGETFRFFAQADWSPTSYNYPYFTSVDADFENAEDGDKNLKYIGVTGSRTIHVNLTTKVVTLD